MYEYIFGVYGWNGAAHFYEPFSLYWQVSGWNGVASLNELLHFFVLIDAWMERRWAPSPALLSVRILTVRKK
jgi:hypothetical protein